MPWKADDITLPIKHPSQKAANIVIAVAVVVATIVTSIPRCAIVNALDSALLLAALQST
jgi:hypothetical protein